MITFEFWREIFSENIQKKNANLNCSIPYAAAG